MSMAIDHKTLIIGVLAVCLIASTVIFFVVSSITDVAPNIEKIRKLKVYYWVLLCIGTAMAIISEIIKSKDLNFAFGIGLLAMFGTIFVQYLIWSVLWVFSGGKNWLPSHGFLWTSI